jgi:hypothetical protein
MDRTDYEGSEAYPDPDRAADADEEGRP